MPSADVSPRPGHGALASHGVNAPAPFSPITSQFRGPFVYNETDEERKKREEDEAKQSNFRKVQEAREAAEAKAEKARADAAEQKVKDFEDQQEAELAEFLKGIPDDKKPKLDPSDPVAKRLDLVKYAFSLLSSGPKPAVGGGARNDPQEKGDRLAELCKLEKERPLTSDEAFELMELSE